MENRLTSAPGGTGLAYDPLGRLAQVTQGATTTRFQYLGARLIAERNASGTLLRRYVHGPGEDEPLVWYEGAGTADRRYLHADERGSIVAVSNGAGVPLALNTYDEYGIPGAGNQGRFQYTGQTWLAEAGLYHYKARVYSPVLGRFLQTDPTGYDDGPNLYSYVRLDPINARDPKGLDTYSLSAALDLFVGPGVGIDVGVYFNPGRSTGEKLDFGVVLNGRLGFGFDQSIGINVSQLTGGTENLNGASVNLAGGLGVVQYSETVANPFAKPSDQAYGRSIGVGISVTSVTANASGGFGQKLGLQDVLGAFRTAAGAMSNAMSSASGVNITANQKNGTLTATFDPRIGTRIAPKPITVCVEQKKCGGEK